MSGKIELLLTDGLIEGYAGKGSVNRITRAGFEGKTSHHPINNGIYHDEWFTPSYLGGGQELGRVDDEAITRLYGGGTPNPEYLNSLGITVKDVGNYLKRKILELGNKTRLFIDCHPKPDGDWQYIYSILQKDPHIPIFLASESIIYQKIHRVHWHPFIISPIK